MPGAEALRRKPEEEKVTEAPRMQVIPVRQEVGREVGAGLERQQATAQVIKSVHDMFDGAISNSNDLDMRENWRNSTLPRLRKTPDLFKDCQVQYAYNQRQDIYSIKTTLDNRPRIITVRVGKNFTELSLADQKGNVLEMARQEDGKGISFTRTE